MNEHDGKIKSKGKFKRLRSRLLFWFLIISLLPITAVFWWNYRLQQEALYVRTEEKLSLILDMKIKRLRDWMTERFENIKLLSTMKELRDCRNLEQSGVVESPEEKLRRVECKKRILALLRDFQRASSAYEEIFIVDAKTARISVSTNPEMVGRSKRTDPYFTNPMNTMRICVKSIYFSHTLRKKGMAISIPIFTGDCEREIAGILVARLNINELDAIFQSKDGLGETGETIIFNRDGYVLNNSRWNDAQSLSQHIGSISVLRALRGETGVIEERDYRGKRVMTAYAYLPFLKWGCLVKQNLYEIKESLYASMFSFYSIFLLSTVAVLTISLVTARAITAPLTALTKAARSIEKGDLSARCEISSNDEIGELSEVFNSMTEELERQFNIQKRIADLSYTVTGINDTAAFAEIVLDKLGSITRVHAAVFLKRSETGFELFKSFGMDVERMSPFKSDADDRELGSVVSGKKIAWMRDIPDNSKFIHKSALGLIVPEELALMPLVVNDETAAIVVLAGTTRFNKYAKEVLKASQTILSAAYAALLAHEAVVELAGAEKRLNKQLTMKNSEIEAQTEELRNQNVELEAQKRRLQELSRLKGEFLSNMSHELRTPLNSILTLSRVLLDMRLDKEKSEYLSVIERNGEKLLEQINNILELSKLESGTSIPRPSVIRIDALVDECVEMIRPLAETKGLRMDTAIETGGKIFTDQSRLRSIIQNLLGNAVKFTEKGEVKVSLSRDDDMVTIKVSDTGVGIPEDQLPHVFDEFRQVDGTASRKHEGTGLGLAIARKAAELIGGRLEVSSKVGVGTCFTLSFPATLPGGGETRLDEDVPSTSKPAESLAGKTILLVDDNEIARLQIKNILEKEKVSIMAAENGRQALELMRETVPDAIVLDLMMPGIDGFDVLNKIRATKETAGIPVLILTAKELTETDMRILKNNHVKQLVQKGNVNAERFLRSVGSLF